MTLATNARFRLKQAGSTKMLMPHGSFLGEATILRQNFRKRFGGTAIAPSRDRPRPCPVS